MARFLLSAIGAFALQSAHGAEWTLSGRVIALKDGDAFVMLDGKTQHPIRIAGIDAPERRQPYSRASKDNLSRLVFNRSVDTRCYKRDRYGRNVCGVFGDKGQDVGLEMVRRHGVVVPRVRDGADARGTGRVSGSGGRGAVYGRVPSRCRRGRGESGHPVDRPLHAAKSSHLQSAWQIAERGRSRTSQTGPQPEVETRAAKRTVNGAFDPLLPVGVRRSGQS